MSVGSILRQRRRELRLTQDQVAQGAGISKPYLSNIETGKAKNPPSDAVLAALEGVLRFEDRQLRRLAHLAKTPSDIRQEFQRLAEECSQLQLALDRLRDQAAEPSTPEHRAVDSNVTALTGGSVVPIINSVAAGYPQHFTDLDYPPSVADEYIRAPDIHDEQAFAARIVGDSMEPQYKQGDIVIFSPGVPAQDGDDCFVRFGQEGGTTFKRVYQDAADTIRLQPLNSRYPSQIHSREEVTGVWPAIYRMQRLR